MMGRQSNLQQKLFYTKFKLEERIPNKHILRQIAGLVDFDFIYREVKDKYGINGNISIPPPVILKLVYKV